jgi:2,4-dienoyl-CoA reductase-like NADH-dependent reductase (Old Yellow Enzyme family)
MAFTSYTVGNLLLKNRIVRSATYEGAADRDGYPTQSYLSLYRTLARNNAGMIITGFSFVGEDGRAMQTAQAGIDAEDKIDLYKRACDEVHKYSTPFIIQLAHTGRQTLRQITGSPLLSSSHKSSVYFRQKPRLAGREEIEQIIEQFARSAFLAKKAGFDGIQLHAAHGYLLHQFLLPETNMLKNEYAPDLRTGLGTKLIEDIFDRIKDRCGKDFPVMIKISGNHDLAKNFFPEKFDSLIRFLDTKNFDAIEISYGTMDHALNIFRGEMDPELVLQYNPIFKTANSLKKHLSLLYIKKFIAPKFKLFSPAYNLIYSERAKKLTKIPIISVGGFRSKREIESAIDCNKTDLAGLSRPFICEPDFVNKLINTSGNYISLCTNCNRCVFMCDSGRPTACYKEKPKFKF